MVAAMAWTDDNLGRRRTPGYPSYNTDQVQLRVDPRDQLDDEISGLRRQVHQLKQVCFLRISCIKIVVGNLLKSLNTLATSSKNFISLTSSGSLRLCSRVAVTLEAEMIRLHFLKLR